MKTMTDDEVIKEMQSTSALNHARRQFSNWSGKIEQAGAQRKPLSPIDMRRMEFDAVCAIAKELGVTL
jgi:hypothetical protein